MSRGLGLLLVGATGAVGQAVLRQALGEKRIAQIVVPTRRPLGGEFAGHEKLLNPVIDFTRLPEVSAWWKVDAVVCTLGTTIKVAGSQAAFAAIDRDLPIAVARLAREAGATRCALNSSLGASARGSGDAAGAFICGPRLKSNGASSISNSPAQPSSVRR